MTNHPIKTIEFHEGELRRIAQRAAADAERRRDYDDDRALSNWAEGATVDYHQAALRVLRDGMTDEFLRLVESGTGRIVNARLVSSTFNGNRVWSWRLDRSERDLIAARGKPFLPSGETSRILRKLGLEEKMVRLPVKSYFEPHCAFVGMPVTYATVAEDE